MEDELLKQNSSKEGQDSDGSSSDGDSGTRGSNTSLSRESSSVSAHNTPCLAQPGCPTPGCLGCKLFESFYSRDTKVVCSPWGTQPKIFNTTETLNKTNAPNSAEPKRDPPKLDELGWIYPALAKQNEAPQYSSTEANSDNKDPTTWYLNDINAGHALPKKRYKVVPRSEAKTRGVRKLPTREKRYKVVQKSEAKTRGIPTRRRAHQIPRKADEAKMLGAVDKGKTRGRKRRWAEIATKNDAASMLDSIDKPKKRKRKHLDEIKTPDADADADADNEAEVIDETKISNIDNKATMGNGGVKSKKSECCGIKLATTNDETRTTVNTTTEETQCSPSLEDERQNSSDSSQK